MSTDQDKSSNSLHWLVESNGVAIASAGVDRPDEVHLSVGSKCDGVHLPADELRRLLVAALVHLGGTPDRADSEVAKVAIELCSHHAAYRNVLEKRLTAAHEQLAEVRGALGEATGQLMELRRRYE